MARARMTRHELRAQDEITTKLQNFSEAVYERRKEILTAAGAVFLIAIGILGWTLYSSSRNAAASAQLSAAVLAFTDPTIGSDKERYEKTIAEAQKTIDAYGSLGAAEIARYFIALSKEGLGDTAGAIKGLEEVAGGDGDVEIKNVAQFALAGIHRRRGESQKAIEALKPLYVSGGYSKSAVTFELAKAHEDAQQKDEAKKYYDQIILEQTDSPFRQDAEAGLKRLGFAIPTPAPPAAPPAP